MTLQTADGKATRSVLHIIQAQCRHSYIFIKDFSEFVCSVANIPASHFSITVDAGSVTLQRQRFSRLFYIIFCYLFAKNCFSFILLFSFFLLICLPFLYALASFQQSEFSDLLVLLFFPLTFPCLRFYLSAFLIYFYYAFLLRIANIFPYFASCVVIRFLPKPIVVQEQKQGSQIWQYALLPQEEAQENVGSIYIYSICIIRLTFLGVPS